MEKEQVLHEEVVNIKDEIQSGKESRAYMVSLFGATLTNIK